MTDAVVSAADVDGEGEQLAGGWLPGVSFGQADKDYLMVLLLAAGLARMRDDRLRMDAGEHLRRTSAEQGLLPVPWRSGMVRLWWRCRRAGAAPPASDLELIELCRQPFATWPVRLRLSATDQGMSLLDGDDLSSLAEQAARLTVRDVEAELVEHQIFAALMLTAEMNAADEQQVQANYVRLRRFLIDSPVMADREVHRLVQRFPAAGTSSQPFVTRFVDAAYVRRPAQGMVAVQICGGCGNPLGAAEDACGTDGCDGTPTTLAVAALGAYLVQHRAARRFFHDPGLVEARIHDRVVAQAPPGSIRVEVWPGLDAYDLRVLFFDPGRAAGTETPMAVWGADAKDQASPWLLAVGFGWKPEPPCKRRFLVLPMHRARQPGYVEDLSAELEGRVSGVAVVDEDRFVAKVAAKARQVVRA
jgi:REase associating with pPIWI_RE/pPIWI_RE three-gene island domain Y